MRKNWSPKDSSFLFPCDQPSTSFFPFVPPVWKISISFFPLLRILSISSFFMVMHSLFNQRHHLVMSLHCARSNHFPPPPSLFFSLNFSSSSCSSSFDSPAAMVSDPLSSSLTCPLCRDFFTSVVETPCCSQGYCHSCLVSLLSSSSSSSGGATTAATCPTCRAPLSLADCRPNNMIQRLVDELPARCPHTGCQVTLTRGILQEHLAKCGFARIACPNGSPSCGMVKQKQKLC